MAKHARVRCVALGLFAVGLLGCTGGQSTDDFSGGPQGPGGGAIDEPGRPGPGGSSHGSMACVPDRAPLPDPDGALRAGLEWVEQSFAIDGRYGRADGVLPPHTPGDAPASGELSIELAPGELTRLSGCSGDRIEAQVALRLRTHEGAFDERAMGRLTVHAELLVPLEPGVTHERRAQLTASIDMTELRGGFSWPSDSVYTYDMGWLSAELSPYGSRGFLRASAVERDPAPLAENESRASPAPGQPLLNWPSESRCGEQPQEDGWDAGHDTWTPTEGDATRAVRERMEQLAATPTPLRYLEQPEGDAEPDGGAAAAASETVSELTLELAPPFALCRGSVLPSRARLRSADGRLDLRTEVNLDLGFPSPFFFNTRYDTAYVYPASEFAERVGHVDAELSGFAHVGVELWFDWPEAGPRGELKVIGWAAGDCLLCSGDPEACSECSHERRVVVLDAVIGEGSE